MNGWFDYGDRFDDEGRTCISIGAEEGSYYVGQWGTDGERPEFEWFDVTDFGAPGIDGIWVWPAYKMNETRLIQFNVNEMTPNAEKIWQERSEADRKRILNDVWCPWCKVGTRIENYSGGVNQNGDLVLGDFAQ